MSYIIYGIATLLTGTLVFNVKDVVADNTHRGKIVSISTEKLVTADKDGKEHRHTLAADVRITLDGKACKVADLQSGMRVRVTTNDNAKDVAIRIEALDKQVEFANAHESQDLNTRVDSRSGTDK
jgi:hypothetical protein